MTRNPTISNREMEKIGKFSYKSFKFQTQQQVGAFEWMDFFAMEKK